jgi:phospholipid/cholesterol/gamma-HCH transport system permease protein
MQKAADAGFVFELGGLARLGVATARCALTPPFNYAPELVDQIRFVLAIAWVPVILMSFALSFGPAGIQASGVLGIFGALDRLGSLYVVTVTREFAPLVSGLIIAGVAGTAVCADLGARVVRDETAALEVLGVDTIRGLVVPRVLALTFCCVMFNVLALVAGVLGAVVVVLENHGNLGAFFSTFFAAASTLEFQLSFVKCAIYGVAISLVCCYKGTHVTGGSEGVGRAVNQAVVVSFLVIGVIDYAFAQFVLAVAPQLSGIR